jgi:hypothetical protein
MRDSNEDVKKDAKPKWKSNRDAIHLEVRWDIEVGQFESEGGHWEKQDNEHKADIVSALISNEGMWLSILEEAVNAEVEMKAYKATVLAHKSSQTDICSLANALYNRSAPKVKGRISESE